MGPGGYFGGVGGAAKGVAIVTEQRERCLVPANVFFRAYKSASFVFRVCVQNFVATSPIRNFVSPKAYPRETHISLLRI